MSNYEELFEKYKALGDEGVTGGDPWDAKGSFDYFITRQQPFLNGKTVEECLDQPGIVELTMKYLRAALNGIYL